jgi:hypothetical protein
MTKKFTIKIEVDPGEKKITIEDNEGNSKIVSGVALFGGMPDDNAYYLFGWGNSSSAAWAYGKGYAHAWNLDDPYYRNFFKGCAQNIARIEAPTILRDEKDMNVDELLEFLDKVKSQETRLKGTVH